MMGPGRPANECENKELIQEFESACRAGDYEFAEEYREELLKRLNSQVKPTDTKKLLEWLEARIEETKLKPVWFAYREMQKEILAGTFSLGTPPAPKQGDKVKYKPNSELGLGEVRGIDVYVKFEKYGLASRISPGDLEVVE